MLRSRTPLAPSLLVFLFAVLLALPTAGCGGGGGAQPIGARDLDGDGILDQDDNDLDGDGRLNQFDDDVDGDGTPNHRDPDADEDGIRNADDDTPLGPWLPAGQTLFVTVGVATVGFGDVPEGQLAGPALITIQNDTVGSISVRRVALAGTGGGTYSIDTSTLPGSVFSLSPGASAVFRASYRPKTGTPALGRVEVDFGIGGGIFTGIVHLLGQGNSPALLASGAPSSINFGDVPVGFVGGPGVARVRNDTAAPWSLDRVALTGTGGGTFTLDLTPLPGASFPMTIPAGGEVQFHVRYAPKQGVPSIGEVAVDISNGTTIRNLGLDLLGQGIAPAMTVTPLELDHGTLLAGVETSTQDVQIRNEFYANGPLTLTAIHLPADAGGAFEIAAAPALPVSLPAGGAPVTVTVRFRPGAGVFGRLNGALRIDGNDPTFPIERTVALQGNSAGWQAPTSALPADLSTPGAPAAATPTWLAGSSRFVVRHAGVDGIWGGLGSADDEIVVIDADPDGDATTSDAREIVRWGGLALSPAPAGCPVDAGTGRHIFFLGGGLDGALGSPDDQLYVLDTVSGSVRALACPNAGQHKSLPVLVDADLSLVVVATGVGGGLVASADTLLVYRNLLGNVNAVAADSTVALEVVVPDVAACRPTAVGHRTVVMACADGSDNPDLNDRALDDGNEGIVQVRDLLDTVAVERLELLRALAESAAPAPGDGFCRPVAVGSTACLVMTEGLDPIDGTDDDIVRIDGVGTATLSVGASTGSPYLSGLASRPVALPDGTFAFASAGSDGVYGTTNDMLTHLDASGALSLAGFGPGDALAGGGGAATRPVVFGQGVLVPTAGINGVVGDADDILLQLDPAVAGLPSILGHTPVPGGLFAGDRSGTSSLAGPQVIGSRFVAVLDKGLDTLEGTADDVLRIVRDKDRDGVLGADADDLDGDGTYDVADTVTLPLPMADGARSPLATSTAGHILLIEAGVDGGLGTGDDDKPVLWWLREASKLP